MMTFLVRHYKALFTVVLYMQLSLFLFCEATAQDKEPIQLAFMADVHLLDVYAELEDVNFKGIETTDGKNAILRTMNAQLHSTRLFNENYFAFLSALDEVVRRGIKYVVLPGDFSDDGQPFNLRGLNRIMDHYAKTYGISFYVITGNHDPTRPFGDKGGKSDFLAEDGRAQPIMSAAEMYVPDAKEEHPVIISEEVGEAGYHEITAILRAYGFFPQKRYLFWATPFSEYSYEDFTLEKAIESASLKNRMYLIGEEGTSLPDVSYLVEPVEGLWLLALDANVYPPKAGGKGFGSSGIGFNRVLKYKKHLVDWVRNVSQEAKRLNKQLIAFSHYPMIDFNDGASQEIKRLFGERGFQSHRVPEEEVAVVFAEAGIKIHIGGHMHLNDTGVYQSVSGNTLVNIQTPSLAGYPPAFKVLTVLGNTRVEVETVLLDSVPDYDAFFDLYRREHQYLEELKSENSWDKGLLESANYHEYTLGHLENLFYLRLLPREWPEEIKRPMKELNGYELLCLSKIDSSFSKDDLTLLLNKRETGLNWENARMLADELIAEKGLNAGDLLVWKGDEMVLDLYKLRNADELALRDIDSERLEQYLVLTASLRQNIEPKLLGSLRLFAIIFEKQLEGAPAIDFSIELSDGKVKVLDKK